MKNRLIYLLPLRSILFIATFIFLALYSGQEVYLLSKWWSIVASFCNIITIIILLLICRKENTTYIKMIRYRKGNSKLLEIILVSIAILIVGLGGMYLSGIFCYGEFPYLAMTLIEPIPLWIAVNKLPAWFWAVIFCDNFILPVFFKNSFWLIRSI